MVIQKTKLKPPCICKGDNGEELKVYWMEGNEVRLEFRGCGKCAITSVYPADKTNVVVKYRL